MRATRRRARRLSTPSRLRREQLQLLLNLLRNRSPGTFQNQVCVGNTQEIMADAWFDSAEHLGCDSHVLALAPYEFSAVSSQQPPRSRRLAVDPHAIHGN